MGGRGCRLVRERESVCVCVWGGGGVRSQREGEEKMIRGGDGEEEMIRGGDGEEEIIRGGDGEERMMRGVGGGNEEERE